MKIAQKVKHCGKPAPPGIYKIEGENAISGRAKSYSLRALSTMEIPIAATNGVYSKMELIDEILFDLNKVCTPNSITGYKGGNNPDNYTALLVMSETIHENPRYLKIALLNKEREVELYTATNDENTEGKGATVSCYDKKWSIWQKASLDADISFWRELSERCQKLV